MLVTLLRVEVGHRLTLLPVWIVGSRQRVLFVAAIASHIP